MLAGGARAQLAGALEHGYFVQPTVFKGHNKMRIFQEEIFGPVVAVTTFKDAEDALSQANDTLYGLGAGVWSRDVNTCYRMGRGIKAGRVWTNCYHAYPAHAAFGGYKQSGIGRENHKMMLNHYQQTKNLLVSYSPKSWASSDPATAAAASRPPPARSKASAVDRVRNARPETRHARSHAARGRHRRGPRPDRHAAGQARPADVSPVRRLLRWQLAHVLRAGRIHGGGADVLLGDLEGCPFYMGEDQFAYWEHTQLIIDAVPARGALAGQRRGPRFLRSRLYSDEEWANVAPVGGLRTGSATAQGQSRSRETGVGPNQLPPRPCLPGGTASADPDCFHWNATRRMRAARNGNERPPGMGARAGVLHC